MKKANYSYIGISFVILIFGIIFIPKIINRINNNEIVDEDRHNLERKSLQKQVELARIGNKTVPDFSLVNQEGDTITNAYYDDKVYVAEFFFTTCPSICPIMTTNMLKVQEAFKEDSDFGIASFSIDPTYDTPQVLKQYADGYGATHPHWNFLTGEKSKIHALANEGFNIYAAQNEEVDGGFEHQGYFALIDKEGNIRSRVDKNGNPIIYYDGLEDESIEMLIEDIQILLENDSSKTN